MFVADRADPVCGPARVFPATLADFQSAGPAVRASVDDASQLDPAPAAGPVRVRACVVPVRRRAERALSPQALQLRLETPEKIIIYLRKRVESQLKGLHGL